MASTWDDICTTVDSWAQKASRKVEQLADSAALELRLSAKKAELEEQYTLLGRLTFEREYVVDEGTVDGQPVSDKIAECVATIHALRKEIETLVSTLGKS
jgi:hypothetical protein